MKVILPARAFAASVYASDGRARRCSANRSNLCLFRLARRFDVTLFIDRLHGLGGEDLFDLCVKSPAAAIAQSDGAASFLSALTHCVTTIRREI